jgi:hypothetical protein
MGFLSKPVRTVEVPEPSSEPLPAAPAPEREREPAPTPRREELRPQVPA